MDKKINITANELYKQYQICVSRLITLLSSESASQDCISQEERNKIAKAEKEYSQAISELQKIKQAVDGQYRSVWESCTSIAGLRRPEAQRPMRTNATWKECVRSQEQIAKEIHILLEEKTQQAVMEKQRLQQIEEAKKAAAALSALEAEKKHKEEAAALEEAKGASLLTKIKEKIKNKQRKK